MVQLTDLDELLAHQLPQPFPTVALHHQHWRESYFFIVHHPERLDDVLILTMASYPGREMLDSIQMGRAGGQRVGGFQSRPYDGDPHTTKVGGVRIEIVKPYEEIRLFADPAECNLGMDLTFRARTKPYGLRRGTMRAGDDIVWDQSHMFQSGTYSGTYTANGETHRIDDWWGQRDHSWGIRDHGRCPLWLWFQIQLPDGFLGVWHWEYANGARVYTDGCWAPTDGSDPIPLVDFTHDVEWIDADGKPAVYGDHGADVAGLRGMATFTLANGQRITVEADGRWDQPYEPMHRGGLNQMAVRTDDGRVGTAIYEVTGSHHHRYFPDTSPTGPLPA